MKITVKLILSTLILSFVATHMSAEKISIRRSNGGPNGYDEVSEYHDTNVLSEDEHGLTCIDPGNSSCSWINSPSITATPTAEDYIDNGNYSDSFTTTHPGGQISYVEWDGTGPYDVLIEETLTGPGIN